MKHFIILDEVGDYSRLVDLKEIKELLKESIKNYVKDNAKDIGSDEIEEELDDLLMIDNCFNMVTIERFLNQYGYQLINLDYVYDALNVIGEYVYNNTLKKDVFNRLEQTKVDLSDIMHEFKD